MAILYRRKVKDPATGVYVERGPYWLKFYRHGRAFYESTGTTNKKEAQRRLKLREWQLASGLNQGPQVDRTRFSDLVKGIQQDYLVNEHRSVRRLNDYLRHLTAHFGDVRVNTMTTGSIKAYIQKRQAQGAANGTINRELSCLKRMFRLAAQDTPPKVAQIPHTPMLEEHNVRSGFFTHEEFLAVRGALPDYAQVAVSIAYYTGMRIGEILGLQWSQVDLVEGKISLTPLQTKTETPRVVYMVPDLNRVLVEAKRRMDATHSGCPWVCQRDGKRVQEMKKSWRKACRRLGLEGRLIHDFRRTAVRNMVRAGVPEVVAMAISGHRTRSVFDRYNIVDEADLKGAAKQLKEHFDREKVTLLVTLAELEGVRCRGDDVQVVEEQKEKLVPPTRIERATRGLGNRLHNPTPAYSNSLRPSPADFPSVLWTLFSS